MLVEIKELKIRDIGFGMASLIEESGSLPEEELQNNIFYKKNMELLSAIPPIKLDNTLKNHYPEISFRDNIDIDVIFAPESLKEDIQGCFDIGVDALGIAAFTHGDMLLGEKMYNDKFQVIIFCPSNESLKEDLNNQEESYKEDYLYSLLNTLPHELSHITHFLESSGGLTPEEVDINFECGEFDNDVTDCILGINHDKYEEMFFDCDDTNMVMEEIIEEKGFILLDKLNVDLEDFEEEINNYFPVKRKLKF